jgi:hypothetical protein
LIQTIDLPSNKGTNETKDNGRDVDVSNLTNLALTPIFASLEDQIKFDNDSFNKMRDTFLREQSRIVDLATETYLQQNKGRKGLRETEQHALNIEIWYHSWLERSLQQLLECNGEVDSFTQGTNVAVVTLKTAFMSLEKENSSDNRSANIQRQIGDALKNVGQNGSSIAKTCVLDTDYLDIPSRESFGEYLGIFGLATRWLLKTEQTPLVLITGLLGFGLLGAACSTVIRRVPSRKVGEPIVANLTNVVIQGASAAILVFLAVFGGLAVFSSGSVNPNPYVVLFTCLVAAVFSEDAWAWGRRQFHSQFTDSHPNNGTQGTGSPKDAAPKGKSHKG